MTEARTFRAQEALELYNLVQLCREMGWTLEELEATDDEFVWACLNVLDLEGKKTAREMEDTKRGVGPAHDRRGSISHHRENQPPTRVPDFP